MFLGAHLLCKGFREFDFICLQMIVFESNLNVNIAGIGCYREPFQKYYSV